MPILDDVFTDTNQWLIISIYDCYYSYYFNTSL